MVEDKREQTKFNSEEELKEAVRNATWHPRARKPRDHKKCNGTGLLGYDKEKGWMLCNCVKPRS